MDIKRLREAAGCSRLCSLSGGERAVAPLYRLTHNGVSFSRQVDVDMYLLEVAEPAVFETMSAWLRAHHAGDYSQPFAYEFQNGRTVLVHEAVD